MQREGDASSHSEWRDAEAAVLATSRLVRIASELGKRVHVLHVSTADEMALLAQHKDVATVEVTPQHLTLTAREAYADLGTRAQMNHRSRRAGRRWRRRSGVMFRQPHKEKSYRACPACRRSCRDRHVGRPVRALTIDERFPAGSQKRPHLGCYDRLSSI
jgi:hypothetical protein